MSDYVNKIKKGNEEYDIHDTRMPIPASGDAGKVVKATANGAYELGTVSTKDARIPDPSAQDEGKALKVNAQGEFELGNDIAKDGRIPDPQQADYGKFLHVNESTGVMEYSEAGGGSEPTPIEVSLGENPQFQALFDAIGESSEKYIHLTYSRFGTNLDYTGYASLQDNGGAYLFKFYGASLKDGKLSDFRTPEIRVQLTDYLYSTIVYNEVDTILKTIQMGNGRFGLVYDGQDLKLKYAKIGIAVPDLPSDASSKTYVLKSVNGTLQWIEEQA